MDVEQYVAERDKSFENDDLDWTRKQLPDVGHDVVEMSFHKARLEAVNVSKEKRLVSKKWLQARNLSPVYGEHLPDDELPA